MTAQLKKNRLKSINFILRHRMKTKQKKEKAEEEIYSIKKRKC